MGSEDEEEVDEVEEEEAPEIDLTGIDDEEIDGLILTEEEVKVKTLVWCRLNAMYLQEEKERKRQEAEDLANGIVKKPPRTKRSKANGGSNGRGGGCKTDAEPATATEAIEKMLKEKKISTKINYDVLKNLESDPMMTGGYTTTPTSAAGVSRSPSSSFRPQDHSSMFKTPGRTPSASASDSKPLVFNHARFKRKIEPGTQIKDEAGSVKRQPTTAGPNISSAGPNVGAAGRKTSDASKVKNLSKIKLKKEEPKEEVPDDDEEEDEEEEEAVSVTEMFQSQFGKEENDYDDYDSG